MKIKKVTFNQLKQSMLNDEIDIIKARFKDYKELEEYEGNDIKQSIKDTKQNYKDIKNLSHLNNYLQEQGFKEWEAYELIIEYLVKLPK